MTFAARTLGYLSQAGINGFSTPTLISSTYSNYLLHGITVNSAGRFVAVGEGTYPSNGYPLFTTSLDGINWSTPLTINGTTTTAEMSAITVSSSGRFVAVGAENSSSYAIYSVSNDGVNWTTPAAMNGSTSVFSPMSSIAVNSVGRFVAIGQSGTSKTMCSYATDGSNWVTPALLNGSNSVTLNDITVTSADLFVAVGTYPGSSPYPVCSTTTDGITWSAPAQMGSTMSGYSSVQMFSVTVSPSGRLVAVGVAQGSGTVMVYSTSTNNGTTWTTPALITGSTNSETATNIEVNSSGRFIATGYKYVSSSYYSIYSTSTDGTTWTTPVPMNSSTDYSYSAGLTVNSSGKFVCVMDNTSAGLYSYAVFP